MERERLSIVQVTTFYPPHNFGGDGIHVQRLSRALTRRGHQVRVVHAPAAYAVLGGGEHTDVGDASHPHDAVDVQPLGAGVLGAAESVLTQQAGVPLLQRGTLKRLLEGPPGHAPDVIHYHNVSLTGGVGVLGMGDAVKLYTTHEYWLVCPTHLLFRYNREICRERTCIRCTLRSGRPPQWWRYTGLRDRQLGKLDSFIFPSAMTESVYRRHGVDGPGRVMHHFLPDDYLSAARSRGARRDDVEPYYLYVGRMDAVKGVEPLLRHFAEIELPAPLVLVGDGPLAAQLRGRYGSHPAIRFLGSRSQDELGALYRDALALILPPRPHPAVGRLRGVRAGGAGGVRARHAGRGHRRRRSG